MMRQRFFSFRYYRRAQAGIAGADDNFQGMRETLQCASLGFGDGNGHAAGTRAVSGLRSLH
jgi:hypothetical protein